VEQLNPFAGLHDEDADVGSLLGSQLHQLFVVVECYVLGSAHDRLNAVLVGDTQQFVHIFIVVRVVLKAENLHEVILNGLSKRRSFFVLVGTIRIFSHLKCVLGLLVQTVGDVRNVLLKDPVGVFFPIILVEKAYVVLFSLEVDMLYEA